MTATRELSETFHDVHDVAEMFGVSERTVWRWMAMGLIPYRRVGPRLVRFTNQDLRDFAERSRIVH